MTTATLVYANTCSTRMFVARTYVCGNLRRAVFCHTNDRISDSSRVLRDSLRAI